jgi:hypothetical protein
LCTLCFSSVLLDGLMLVYAGDEGVGGSRHQDSLESGSALGVDGDDKVSLECLEHVSFCEGFSLDSHLFSL